MGTDQNCISKLNGIFFYLVCNLIAVRSRAWVLGPTGKSSMEMLGKYAKLVQRIRNKIIRRKS